MNRVPVPEESPVILGPWQPTSLLSEEVAYRTAPGQPGKPDKAIFGLELAAEVEIAEDAPTRLYIVVDELIDDHLTLSVSLWPWIDSRGRARFPRVEGRWRIGASTPEMGQFLFAHRRPDPTRELRIGDVFAAMLVEGADLDDLTNKLIAPWDWIAPPVIDISAEARDLVKAAFYSAVAPPLRPEQSGRDRAIIEDVDSAFPETAETEA